MTTKVVHIKLINGEEIIGKLVEPSLAVEAYMVLEKVRSLTIQPIRQGEAGIGLIPFMVGNPDGSIRIDKRHILGEAVEDTPKQLEDAYLQQVSGLTFATQGNDTGKIIT